MKVTAEISIESLELPESSGDEWKNRKRLEEAEIACYDGST